MSRDYRAGCSIGQGKVAGEGRQSEFRFQDDRDGQGKESRNRRGPRWWSHSSGLPYPRQSIRHAANPDVARSSFLKLSCYMGLHGEWCLLLFRTMLIPVGWPKQLRHSMPFARNQWTGKTTLRRSRNRDAYCEAKPIGFMAVVRNSDRHRVGTAGLPMTRKIYLKSRQQPGYTHCCRRFSMQARRCVCRVMS